MRSKGFTIIELMIGIAILAVIAGIAVPIYNNYIREARLGAARTNMEGLRIYLEDWRLDNGSYDVDGSGSFDPEALAQLDWQPEGDKNAYIYSVTATTNTYAVLVEWAADTSQWVRCEGRMDTCCDNETSGATKTACP